MKSAFKIILALSAILGAQQAQAEDRDLFPGDKLLLTNGITSIEGASGGGLASWSTIAGRETDRGVGLSGHVTVVELADFGLQSHGIAVGLANRVELSYARHNFDTRDVGAALGIGRGYNLNQDIFGAKIRLFGDLVYGDPLLPQVSVGVQHKRNQDGPIAFAVGARDDQGTDFTLSAAKLVLSHSILLGATARLTSANEGGLLGFGNASGKGKTLQFEGSLGYQLTRRAIIGAEFRSKPDNLRLGESDWYDLFAAYAVTDKMTVTAAYADLGTIATFEGQRGVFLSAQIAF